MYQSLYTYNPRIIHNSISEGRESQLGKALSSHARRPVYALSSHFLRFCFAYA